MQRISSPCAFTLRNCLGGRSRIENRVNTATGGHFENSTRHSPRNCTEPHIGYERNPRVHFLLLDQRVHKLARRALRSVFCSNGVGFYRICPCGR